MFHCTSLQLLVISIGCILAEHVPTTEQILETTDETFPPYTCYECLDFECRDYAFNRTCNDGISCFTHYEIKNGSFVAAKKGCHVVPFIELVYCNGEPKWLEVVGAPDRMYVHKCCEGDFCNVDEFTVTPVSPIIPIAPSSIPTIENEKMTECNSTKNSILLRNSSLSNVCLSFVAVLSLSILIVVLLSKRIVNKNSMEVPLSNHISQYHHQPTAVVFSGNAGGSGSSDSNMSRRSFSQDVVLVKRIGGGRFGDVWQGEMYGESVAVKIFSSTEGASWANEVNIYTNMALYHENVLGFKGSTVASRLGVTELWLLTAFHEQGSLYDYLMGNTISHKQMIIFVRSICAGLLHLHSEYDGNTGKPAIAHRDLKTKNILLTSQGTCVIADFGLAVVKNKETYDSRFNQSMPVNYRVGTKRYMAPEVLDETMNINMFESFRRADIYSFGLMLWEICSCCKINGRAEPFRLAFHDSVPSDPDFGDMKKVVCLETKRPEIPDRWSSDEPLTTMAKLMKNCWHKNPEVRNTMWRVKKIVDKVHAQIEEQ